MNWFIFIFLAFILILSPYHRGLYFDTDFYGVQLVIFVLFMMLFITLVIKKELHTLKPIWFACLVPVMFLISLFNAENPQGAWDSVLRWTSYIAFFFLLYWAVLKDRNLKKLLPILFQITSIWIAVHMMLNEFGWLEFPNAFIFNRFAGVFQYPNTFGMVMIVFYLFSLIMLLRGNVSYLSIILYAAPLILFFIGFIESYSRGMYFVFPVAWFVGLLLLRPSSQVKYVGYTVFSVVGALMMILFLQSDAPLRNAIILFILCLLTTGLVWFIENNQKLNSLIIKLDSKNKFIGPAVILMAAVLLLLDIGFEGQVYQQLPASIQERITSINESATARERIIMMEDAINMSKDSPVIGFGGDAWESVYKKYQQLPYQANKVHNEYLELVIDIGWLGTLLFITIFGTLYYRIWKNYQPKSNPISLIAVFIASLVISLHSFIDFNLSYGAIWFMICWLLVMGLTPTGQTKTATPLKLYTKLGLFAFAAIIMVASFFSYQFMHAEQAYQKAIHSNVLEEKEVLLEEAVNRNPYQFSYMLALGDVYIQLSEHKQTASYHPKVEEISKNVSQLEPNNSLVLYRAGVMLERIGEIEKAIPLYLDALEVDPFDSTIYETTITTLVDLAVKQENTTYAQEALIIYEKLVQTFDQFEENPIGKAHNSRDFHITEQIHAKIAETLNLLSK
ncbi:O-antigen ligase family protein [Oceanobacillus salinisoli]|uniref:O-antigen ligase family protein n=1 Tax=Oceanobacillus salinisoli TaxID=2678611 RepID=UPI0018CC6846|nr:O-antigen ligase family protein [Oceanobacillus salinisoli]